jgi:hypothetical protein
MPATPITNPLLMLLGLLSATTMAAALLGIRLPFLPGDRAALIALLVLGMAMCALGMQTTNYGWLSPFTLGGILLGAVALAVAAAALAGIRLPYIGSDRAAIIAIALLMGLKVLLAVIRGSLA